MHSCPYCGQACDCTGDDTWNEAESVDCQCECEWLADDGDYHDDFDSDQDRYYEDD